MDMLEQQRLNNEAKLTKAQEEMERSYEQKAAEFERKVKDLEADVCTSMKLSLAFAVCFSNTCVSNRAKDVLCRPLAEALFLSLHFHYVA